MGVGSRTGGRQTSDHGFAAYCQLLTAYFSERSALCRFSSAIIGENLRLKLFAGLAQPKADPSSGGVLAFRPGFRPVGATPRRVGPTARRARKTLLKSFC